MIVCWLRSIISSHPFVSFLARLPTLIVCAGHPVGVMTRSQISDFVIDRPRAVWVEAGIGIERWLLRRHHDQIIVGVLGRCWWRGGDVHRCGLTWRIAELCSAWRVA